MKKAIPIVGVVGGLMLFSGIWIYQMGKQLHWHAALVGGVYICVASVVILLIAGVLNGVNWIRKNVRIQ
jgi:hypothetical protein